MLFIYGTILAICITFKDYIDYMRLIQKQIDSPLSERLIARRVRIPCFDEEWHFHPELELIYLIKSKGIRFLGDNIADFSDDELVLTGSNLPHLWRNQSEYFSKKKKNIVDVIIIQFRDDFMGNDFPDSKEGFHIKQLFELSRRGILFTGEEKKKAIKLIKSLPDKKGLPQLIDFLAVLNILSEVKNPQLISGPYFKTFFRQNEHERINKVTQYLLDNFRENISLEKVASIANMSPNAFCRYFKNRTNRTMIQFLNEIRVSHACKIIMNEKKKISEISLICGFNSLTLFNRQFRHIMKMSPMEYRTLHQND